MKAVGVVEFGGPDSLKVVDIPERHAEPGEVRIRVAAAAVNPTDTLLRSGARAVELQALGGPPYIPGMDVAGIIDEIGAEIGEGTDSDLHVGDSVMAIVLPRLTHGGYSESIVLPATSVVRAPVGSSHAEACSLPMNALTARRSLDLLHLDAGATIFVGGAAGAYGGYLIQLAKADGLRVIADASAADEELVRSLGADDIVRRGDDVAERILALAPNGVDAVADGALQGALLFPAVRDGGGFAVVRGIADTPPRGIEAHATWVRDYAFEHAKLDRLGRMVEEGLLTPRVAQVLPADQAPEAHRLLEAGGIRGRLVLSFES
ncbi:Qor NADPH,quinone reductase and related Zn-dependent oxidoreductases [Acidimicrobiia bacterium]